MTAPNDTFRPENNVSRGRFAVGDTEPAEDIAEIISRGEIAITANAEVTSETVREDTGTLKTNTVMYDVGHFIPKKSKFYLKWGDLPNDLGDVFDSRMFFTVYVSGLSGNGKTMGIIQAAAVAKREIIRVNITESTDEDDLLGGFRLINGDTVWEDGPVIVAMKRGALLLLDEVDLGSELIMCLQPVLEGSGVYIKKINKFVYPESGFNVIATGNTKGKGDDGEFAHTNIMNEAMLDRFDLTLDQTYPSLGVETNILKKAYAIMAGIDSDEKDIDFMTRIAKTAQIVRASYDQGHSTAVISTRRLVGMVKAYIVFKKDRVKAVTYSLNRFENKDALLDIYMTIDENAHEQETIVDNERFPDDIPF